MRRTMLKSKVHRATVTGSDLNYVGSITMDSDLLEAADIREHELVQVLEVPQDVSSAVPKQGPHYPSPYRWDTR